MSVGLYSGTSGLALGVGLYSGVPGFWSGATGLIDGLSPALDLNFLSSTSLDSRVTFSRGSAATLTDSTGKITYAPNNLVTFSEQFDNAAWTKTFSSVVANAATAPDGTTTADKLVEDTTNNGHNILAPGAVVVGNTYVHSVYLKAAGRNIVEFYGSGFAAQGFFAKFNLSNGTMFTNTGSRGAIQSVGNGWYRCSIWLVASGTSPLTIALCDGSGNNVYIGDGTSGVFMWGAQLEQVTYQTTPGTYVATTSSAYQGPRFDYDPVTLAPKGLLIEEQRTNLLRRSEEFDNASWTKTAVSVVANAATSPDGTVDADHLIGDTTATGHILTQVGVASAASGTTYTASVYLKAEGYGFAFVALNGTGYSTPQYISVNLSTGATAITNGTPTAFAAINSGNGWWRVIVTATTNVAAGTVQCDVRPSNDGVWANRNTAQNGTSGIFLYGAQLEAGAFATSYIPTVASQVTRSADVATMTGTNFSSWYNQTEGTFVAGFSQLYSQQLVGTQGGIVRADDGTNNNQISIIKQSNTNQIWASVTSGGAGGLSGNIGPHNANETKTAALAYKSGDSAGVLSGGTPLTSASANVPTALDRLRIGSSSISAGAWMLNGHLRSIQYYKTRLSNTQLQALTA